MKPGNRVTVDAQASHVALSLSPALFLFLPLFAEVQRIAVIYTVRLSGGDSSLGWCERHNTFRVQVKDM